MAYLYQRRWRRDELLRHVGHMDQLAGIKAMEASDGAERGSRILRVWTGSGLAFDVLPDRALDIFSCHYHGMPLAWCSPVGAVHPAFFEPRGLGWLRSFQGGLCVTCGLDQFGAPSQDAGEALGLHGRISHLPARAVAYRTFWQDDEYLLEIDGEVRQWRLFGENLVLRRRISARLGWPGVRIEDSVTNEGYQPSPHMILYHFNLGFPLLSADSRLRLAVERTIPRDDVAAGGLAAWDRFQAPTPGFAEQVFLHEPKADADGRQRAEVVNPTLGIGLRLTYDSATLPHLFQWKMLGEGAYVLGLEPANCNVIEGRASARQRQALPSLSPGETRTYCLEVEVVDAV